VICSFMALLSFVGISTPSLPAQGEQRRSSYFNIGRDIPVPAFFAQIADDVEGRALRFVILTGARRNEALSATWDEFDLVNRTWTIPGERTKMGREHVVPLTGAMLAAIGPAGNGLVFPSKRPGKPLGHEAIPLQQYGITLHGFRASFASWAEEQDDGRAFPHAIIEAALGHAKGDATTQAYFRNKMFDARRALAEAWSKFATSNHATGTSGANAYSSTPPWKPEPLP
jgi:integrase